MRFSFVALSGLFHDTSSECLTKKKPAAIATRLFFSEKRFEISHLNLIRYIAGMIVPEEVLSTAK